MRKCDFHGFTVKNALEQLEIEISLTRKTKDKSLEIVVGYGSKTGNHKIKTAILEYLDGLKCNKKIKNYIAGNDCYIFSSKYLDFEDRDRIPELAKYHPNPGIIYVFL